jgi:hypothetical protein
MQVAMIDNRSILAKPCDDMVELEYDLGENATGDETKWYQEEM